MASGATHDPVSMGQALSYYDDWLEFRQRYLCVPGVQAAVFVDDHVALSSSHGYSDLDNQELMTERHLFRIASHSKTFTATLTFHLIERGVLRLDDTAGDWVTELAQASSSVAHVTVRELLSHAAGIYRDGSNGDFWQLWQPFPDRDALIETLRSPAATVLPRNERFKYSNIGYGLLGLILEAASGRPYAQLAREAIIAPLGLHDCGPEFNPARANEYATGYSALSYQQSRVPIDHVDTGALAPATGFYSTAKDLVTYFSAHFHGDDRLLRDDSKRVMQQVLWDTGRGRTRYSHGLAIVKIGDRTMIGHSGGYPGHITLSIADPLDRIAVSVFTNAIDGPAEPLAHAAVKLIDLACARPRPDAGLHRFTGRFASLWGVVDVALLGGHLYLVNPTQSDPVEDIIELEALDESTLKIMKSPGYGSYGELIRYEFAADDRVASVRGPSATTLKPLDAFRLPQRVHRPE